MSRISTLVLPTLRRSQHAAQEEAILFSCSGLEMVLMTLALPSSSQGILGTCCSAVRPRMMADTGYQNKAFFSRTHLKKLQLSSRWAALSLGLMTVGIRMLEDSNLGEYSCHGGRNTAESGSWLPEMSPSSAVYVW